MGGKLIDRFLENAREVEEVFNQKGVIIACLFGSGSVKGKDMGPLWDLDFAVKFSNSLTKIERQQLYLKILSRLISLLGDEIDLVVMNDAGILLQFNITKEGEILFKNSERAKIRLESRIIHEYLDTRYYRERHTDEKISKLAERGFQ